MSVLKVTVTREHLDLLKAINWSLNDDKYVVSTDILDMVVSPFGGDNLYEDMDMILNGKPKEFNPLSYDPLKSDGDNYDAETKAKFDKLMGELPLVLEIVLRTQSFELGTYRAKFHDRTTWKKIA